MIAHKTAPSATIAIFDVMNAETPTSTGTVSAQTGASLVTLGIAETGENNSIAEVWHPSGLISIPALPNANSNNLDSSQCLSFIRDDQNIAFAFRDTRTELLGGNVTAGETVLYNSGKARVSVKADDSITLSTKDSSDNAIYFQLSTTALTFMAPWGRIVFDGTGLFMATANGCMFNMGGVSLPGPLSVLGSAITMSAAMVTVSAPTVMLGNGPLKQFFQAVVPIAPYVPSGTPLPVLSTTTAPGVWIGF